MVSVACGSYHTGALTADGALFTFGRGGGRLGHESLENILAVRADFATQRHCLCPTHPQRVTACRCASFTVALRR